MQYCTERRSRLVEKTVDEEKNELTVFAVAHCTLPLRKNVALFGATGKVAHSTEVALPQRFYLSQNDVSPFPGICFCTIWMFVCAAKAGYAGTRYISPAGVCKSFYSHRKAPRFLLLAECFKAFRPVVPFRRNFQTLYATSRPCKLKQACLMKKPPASMFSHQQRYRKFINAFGEDVARQHFPQAALDETSLIGF